jgi:tetratricopeptide (TPR) repeat protein
MALLLLFQATEDPMAAASAHLDAGRTAEAIAILSAVVEKEPENLPARFNLAVAQAMAGQDGPAVEGFRKVLAAQPGLYEAELNLGQLLVKGGQFEEAATHLKSASEKKPDQARPVLALARAYAGQQKWTEAGEALTRCLTLDPRQQDLDLELASYLEKAGKAEEALAIYRKHPENAAARERVALHLLDTGDAAGAIEQLEALLKQSPTPGVKYALATAYLRAKQPEKSIPLAQSILEQEPGNHEIRLFLGRLLRDQKRYADAARQFAVVAKAQPQNLEAWNEFAGMLILLEQHEAALQALEQARQLGGDRPAYHYFRATILDSQKQYKPALESYRRFLELSGGKLPDEEFKARQRARIIERILSK